jgi:hypothetical protein
MKPKKITIHCLAAFILISVDGCCQHGMNKDQNSAEQAGNNAKLQDVKGEKRDDIKLDREMRSER